MADLNDFDLTEIAASSLVRHLEFRDVTDSTQGLARQLARRDVLDTPALVLAGQQTCGRGRGGRIWWSDAGSLTFSLVLGGGRLGVDQVSQPRVSIATALAVCQALSSQAPPIHFGIKWPNDVVVAGRKICGVLIDVTSRAGSMPPRWIVGVGINVNNSVNQAPQDIAQTAVSLADCTNRKHPLNRILMAVLEEITTEWQALSTDASGQVQRWQARSVLDDRRVSIRRGTTQDCGFCRGIDESGALVLDKAAHLQHFVSGEVVGVDPPLGTPTDT